MPEAIDRHKERAAAMFGVPIDEVTPKQRSKAKELTFLEYYSNRPLRKIRK